LNKTKNGNFWKFLEIEKTLTRLYLAIFLFPFYIIMETEKSLNSDKTYYCECCDYTTPHRQCYKNHEHTIKHKKRISEINGNVEEIEKTLRTTKIYHCENCNYTTIKKTDFDRHHNTIKHNQPHEEKKHICAICNKRFSNASGLWKHKKKCIPPEEQQEEDECEEENKGFHFNVFMEIMKQNKEFQQFMAEQNREIQNIMIEQNEKIIELAKTQNVVATTNNNNQFNIQLFLNERCKNALNINEFIDTLEVTTEDFEETGRLGYVDGISRIFINGLRNLGVENRPLHCTDLKRETVYIKHDDKWEKEGEEKNLFLWLVKTISNLNLQQLPKWLQKNPYHVDVTHRQNDEYIRLSMAALGGNSIEHNNELYNKIMKNVMKVSVIDKKSLSVIKK